MVTIMLILAIPFIIGLIIGIYQIIKGYQDNNDIPLYNDMLPGSEIPYYINEQIQAIYKQLETYHNLIDSYREQAAFTNDINKRLVLNKRIADLEYKCSKLEEKVYKLLEKWEE